MSRHHSAVWPALVFEGALGLVAVLVAALCGWPSPLWAPSPPARPVLQQVALGVAATLPLIGALLMIEGQPGGWLHEIKRDATRLAVRLFRDATLAELALVSAVAGLGEELFFRGLLIGSLSQGVAIGVSTALLLSSVIFGLAHPINRSYALAAGVVGAYLGALYLWSGGVLAPILAHGLYDFFALWYLLRVASRDEWPAPGGEGLDESETAGREGANHE